MVQSTKFRHRYDPTASIGAFHGFPTSGRLLRQRELRPVIMVVLDVLSHEPLQLAFVKHDDVVQQIAAAVADEALGDAVLPRTSETCSLGVNAETLHSVNHFEFELMPTIKDQVTCC